ncbi:hypothetical protein ACH5A3_24495 [Streptomyces echinatus]|uniref:hypothetical protein n=1 Tax=Streptomyces echinatus TaxID=67293 RepID=UPI00379BAC0A
MGSVVVGVVGTLLGVLIGGALQQLQARLTRRWQQEDAFSAAKQVAYSEYLRSISAGYGQAKSGQRNRSEDSRLYAATAQIEILAGQRVAIEARELAERIIEAHSMIAAGAGDERAGVPEIDRDRHAVIELFKTDLGLGAAGPRG